MNILQRNATFDTTGFSVACSLSLVENVQLPFRVPRLPPQATNDVYETFAVEYSTIDEKELCKFYKCEILSWFLSLYLLNVYLLAFTLFPLVSMVA